MRSPAKVSAADDRHGAAASHQPPAKRVRDGGEYIGGAVAALVRHQMQQTRAIPIRLERKEHGERERSYDARDRAEGGREDPAERTEHPRREIRPGDGLAARTIREGTCQRRRKLLREISGVTWKPPQQHGDLFEYDRTAEDRAGQ